MLYNGKRRLCNNNVKIRNSGIERTFSKKEVNDIITRYENGVSVDSLKTEYKTSKPIIKKVLLENNINLRRGYSNKMTEEEKENIIKDYKNGISPDVIRKRYRKSKVAIIRTIKNGNIDRNDITLKIFTQSVILGRVRSNFNNSKIHYNYPENMFLNIKSIVKKIEEYLGLPPDSDIWHLDHIVPKWKLKNTKEEIERCWWPENFQYLVEPENTRKSKWWCKDDYKKLMKMKPSGEYIIYKDIDKKNKKRKRKVKQKNNLIKNT